MRGKGERHPEPARVKDPVTFIPKLLIDFIQNFAYIYTE